MAATGKVVGAKEAHLQLGCDMIGWKSRSVLMGCGVFVWELLYESGKMLDLDRDLEVQFMTLARPGIVQ